MAISYTIQGDDDGIRVDKFLRRELPSVPLSHIFKLIRTRKVRINRKRAKTGERLKAGDIVHIHSNPEHLLSSPSQMGRVATKRRDFELIHEDEHILGVLKPAGLAIHPGTGISGATLVDQVRAWLGCPAEKTPGFTPSPAHRLDKDTSGVVLIARTRIAMAAMTDAFTSGSIKKTYLAMVKGVMPSEQGIIEAALQERQQTLKSRQIHGMKWQNAITEWRLISASDYVSIVEVKPKTGRTHQIRRHFAGIEHPIAGDARYGDFRFNRKASKLWKINRQMLHAWKISFNHPVSGESMEMVATAPKDMRKAAEILQLPKIP